MGTAPLLVAGLCACDEQPEDSGPLWDLPAPDLRLAEVAWKFTSSEGAVGYHADGGSDLDGDGVADLALGACDTPEREGFAVGQVYLFLGPVAGSADERGVDILISGIEGANQEFGYNVAMPGDVDGDGWADLAASEFSNPGAATAYLFPGPITGDLLTSDASASIFAATLGDEGHYIEMEALGDMNGDGLGDLAFALHDLEPLPRVHVVYGPIEGETVLDRSGDGVEIHTDCSYGLDAAGVGDVDGDGLDDLLVGNYRDSIAGTWNGAAYLYSGPLDGLQGFLAATTAVVLGEHRDEVGLGVGGAADSDGDGYRDVLITVQGDEDRTGAALFRGPITGVHTVWEADTLFLRRRLPYNVILTVAGPGDLDGDGRDDVALGAQYESAGTPYTGAIWVVLDPEPGTVDLVEEASLLSGERWERAGVYLDPVGDLDGDGAPELASFALGDPALGDSFSYIIPGALWRQ